MSDHTIRYELTSAGHRALGREPLAPAPWPAAWHPERIREVGWVLTDQAHTALARAADDDA